MNRSRVFWSVVSATLSCVFLVDLITWLVSGSGLGQLVSGGPDSPLVMAIASHLFEFPEWAFYAICAASVLLLSIMLAVCIVCCFHPGGSFHFRGRMFS